MTDYIDKDKLAKSAVDYSYGKPNAHCSLCEHFIRSGFCHIVAGKIDPAWWCNRFKRD